MPTFDLSVWDAYAVISAPAFVSALKSVVLPALGSPTMPTSSATAAKGTRPARSTNGKSCGSPTSLEAEPDPGVARETLQIRNAAEDDCGPAVVRIELVRSLGAGGERVLERVGARGRDVGGDDRAAGEGNLDPNGFR